MLLGDWRCRTLRDDCWCSIPTPTIDEDDIWEVVDSNLLLLLLLLLFVLCDRFLPCVRSARTLSIAKGWGRGGSMSWTEGIENNSGIALIVELLWIASTTSYMACTAATVLDHELTTVYIAAICEGGIPNCWACNTHRFDITFWRCRVRVQDSKPRKNNNCDNWYWRSSMVVWSAPSILRYSTITSFPPFWICFISVSVYQISLATWDEFFSYCTTCTVLLKPTVCCFFFFLEFLLLLFMMMGLILRATGLLVTSSRNGNDTALIGNEFIIVLCRCFDFDLAFFVIMGWYGGNILMFSIIFCMQDCKRYLSEGERVLYFWNGWSFDTKNVLRTFIKIPAALMIYD